MDEILCRYCGYEMKPFLHGDGLLAFACYRCGSRSPIKDSFQSSKEAALRRPLQKPMSLEEFKKSGFAFIELNKEYYADIVFPAQYMAFGYSHYSIVLTKCNKVLEGLFNIDDDENQAWINNDDYGREWRCWATKPTQEEREAAKWE